MTDALQAVCKNCDGLLANHTLIELRNCMEQFEAKERLYRILEKADDERQKYINQLTKNN